MANGSRHGMYIAAEATYGVSPAGDYPFYRHNTTTLALAKNTLQSEEIRPDRQIRDFRMGTGQAGGNVVSELSFGSFDNIIEALFLGSWTDNTVKIGTTRRSFTIVREFGDLEGAAPNNKKFQTLTGMEANTLALQVNTEAIVNATIGWVGRDLTLSAAAPAGAVFAAPTEGLAMDSFTGTITEDGVAIAVITEITLNLENGIEPRFVVGSRKSIKPSLGMATVTGQITAYFEDSYLLEKYINEQTSNIEFTLTDGDAGNAYKFVLPRIKYTGGQTDVAGQGPITLPLPFQCTYSPGEESTISITRIPA